MAESNRLLNRYAALGSKEVSFQLKPCLRVNTLKISHQELVNRLTAKGVKLTKIPFAKDGFWFEKPSFSLTTTTEFLLGYFYLQEAAAQLPVEVLSPLQSDLVLDACAAPGGKSTQLAQWMKNEGVVVSFEKNNRRLLALKTHLERCGVSNVVAYNTSIDKVSEFGSIFDRILLDVPCSSNFIADQTWLESHTIEDVQKLAALQKSMLVSCVGSLKKRGTLVYATCSLEPEENELIIDWAVKNMPVKLEQVNLSIGSPALTKVFDKQLSPEVAKCKRFWPSKTQTQGFFIAKLVKI